MKYKMNWNDLLSEESARERRSNKTAHSNNNDLRSAFEKDYHRILISASFRRLQDKTQVFPLEKNDFVRTRLTHSIEVSSFAKSLAQSVSNRIINENIDPNFTRDHAANISDILASAGLLHDIGNPPFGHFGEDTIRAWFDENLDKIEIENPVSGKKEILSEVLGEQMKKDLLNFEGNAQALRLVSKLHFLIDENGMNLTYALLNTLVKYPVSSLEIDKNSGDIKTKKMGYYLSEEDLFKEVAESTGTLDKKTGVVSRHPLTYLLEAADDIAYATADIEDGFKKGIISFNDLLKVLEVLKEKEKSEIITYDKLILYKEKAIEKNYEKPEMYAIQRWMISVQGVLIHSAVSSFIKNYDQIMNGEYKEDLFKDNRSENLIKLLKKLAQNKIFHYSAITKMEIKASNIINFFLNNFVRAVLYYDTSLNKEYLSGMNKKYLALISDNYAYIYRHYAGEFENRCDSQAGQFSYKLYLRLLLVTDYICGMTDTYAKTLFEDLAGIR